ncbi:nitroreductase/quinone reductase family protein [uncultured Jatrophihabitans sp.]|uniref:nitroreductase/quinone reductase family protein n=1 Tax=uncultured Jatrophihabitans sp. TaxID=1610747 RepID=UPI0035CBA7EB
MPHDVALKTMNLAHRLLIKASLGRFGYDAGNMPVLELTTVGRKSGAARSVMLTAAGQDGDRLIVVASRGGDPTHPAWFLNLRDNPDVEVKLRDGPRVPMRATVLSADERARVWPELSTRHPMYAAYQKRTDREIPLVWLAPR